MEEALTSFRLCRLTVIRKTPSPVDGAMLECAVALGLVVKGAKWVSEWWHGVQGSELSCWLKSLGSPTSATA